MSSHMRLLQLLSYVVLSQGLSFSVSSIYNQRRTTLFARSMSRRVTLSSATSLFFTAFGPVSSSRASASASAVPTPAMSDIPFPTRPRYRDQDVSMVYSESTAEGPRTRVFLVRRYTGESTPYKFSSSPVRLVKKWPDKMPFTRQDFSRSDEHKDNEFYAVPRFVYHIDEGSVSALTNYYKNNIQPNSSILDIASSWVSHYPVSFPTMMKRISGCGMNKFEMMANDQLNDYTTKDLNERDSNNADLPPELPYADNTFDVVTCVVSIDYMIHPIEVLKEVHRVLKPGGKAILSQSNRCFPSKAVNMWLGMNDRQHLELINGYFQYAGGFDDRLAFDISAKGGDANDPMFIIQASKSS